jgi:hypothetical protein
LQITTGRKRLVALRIDQHQRHLVVVAPVFERRLDR